MIFNCQRLALHVIRLRPRPTLGHVITSDPLWRTSRRTRLSLGPTRHIRLALGFIHRTRLALGYNSNLHLQYKLEPGAIICYTQNSTLGAPKHSARPKKRISFSAQIAYNSSVCQTEILVNSNEKN